MWVTTPVTFDGLRWVAGATVETAPTRQPPLLDPEYWSRVLGELWADDIRREATAFDAFLASRE